MPGSIEAIIATLCFASAAIFVRGATGLSPAAVAFFRMALAVPLMLLWAIITRAPLLPPRGRRLRFAVWGLITAGHFVCYIASLGLTTIAHALVLVNTAPLFTVAFGALWLRERPRRAQYPGMILALVGIAVLAGLEPTLSRSMALGDLLALTSGALYGIYSVIGRGERESLPLPTYALWVYAAAAAWLWPAASLPLTLPSGPALMAVVLLAIVPTSIGHTLYNAALRKGPAAYMNLIATQEATGGIILGALFLGEIPSIVAVIGALIAVAGIVWTTVAGRQSKTPPAN